MSEMIDEILLVKDNPNDEELALRALQKYNLANNIHVVRDGAQALDYIFCKGEYVGRKFSQLPKLILLDLKLPKVSGHEVLERIKSDKRTQSIPVVVLTSSDQSPDIQKCYHLGANSYIVKPVDFEQFTESVRQIGLYWLLLNQPNAYS